MMIEALNHWIEESIKFMQSRIDDASSHDYHDAKLRSEGYLEALIHCQNFILSELDFEE